MNFFYRYVFRLPLDLKKKKKRQKGNKERHMILSDVEETTQILSPPSLFSLFTLCC